MKLLIIFLWILGIKEERALEHHSGPDPASAVLAWLHLLLQADGLHLSAQLPADTPPCHLLLAQALRPQVSSSAFSCFHPN